MPVLVLGLRREKHRKQVDIKAKVCSSCHIYKSMANSVQGLELMVIHLSASFGIKNVKSLQRSLTPSWTFHGVCSPEQVSHFVLRPPVHQALKHWTIEGAEACAQTECKASGTESLYTSIYLRKHTQAGDQLHQNQCLPEQSSSKKKSK